MKSVHQAPKTFLLNLEYDGTNYNGFQRQEGTKAVDAGAAAQRNQNSAASSSSNKRKRGCADRGRSPVTSTIQDRIEAALVMLTGRSLSELRVRGAGRTDKGVHALGQIVAFDYFPSTTSSTSASSTATVRNEAIATATSDDPNQKQRRKKQKKAKQAEAQRQQERHSSFLDDINDTNRELWQIRRAINSRLPEDIVVRSVRLLPDPPPGGRPFEARRDVSTKQYVYKLRFRKKRMLSDGVDSICNSGPHTLRRAHGGGSRGIWICPWALDEKLLQETCRKLSGEHDFSCFVVKSDRRMKHNNINLTRFSVRFRDDVDDCDDVDVDEHRNIIDTMNCESCSEAVPCNAIFLLEAGGFRRQMVRRLVGFTVDVARGQLSIEDVPRALQGSDEAAKMVNAAPACGLYLSKVQYMYAKQSIAPHL